ncbi:unnamed protein product [Sphagnum troendelagicum]|uniref:Small EDRK-rich factor-like N-terminal domain-containing protein n=1 Tax=Sphagnum troendelagicum TaxID=128251 RepID=A0ABP0TG82_9BRYO
MISSLALSDPGLLLRTKKRTKRDKVKEKRDEQSVDRNRLEKGKDVERAAMSAKWEKKQTVQSATQREQEEREKRRHKSGA